MALKMTLIDEDDLVLIRAYVLHDLRKFVPDNYRIGAVNNLGHGRTDWTLGKMLAAQKPSMTERQALACEVLLLIGLYRVASDSLARRETSPASEQVMAKERADKEAEFSKLDNDVLFFEYQLRVYLTLYAAYLPKNKASALTSLIVLEGCGPVAHTEDKSNDSRGGPPAADTVEARLADLFDPLSRAGIAALFNMIDKETWKKYFARAARNGLSVARQKSGTAIRYNPYLVGKWLINTNANCTQGHINRKLANNLPRRSKSMKELFTDGVD